MKFKKIISGAVAAAMSLSMITLVTAQTPANIVENSFSNNKIITGNSATGTKIAYDATVTHTADGTGSVKIPYVSNFANSSNCYTTNDTAVYFKFINQGLQVGKTYRATAYIKGENVTSTGTDGSTVTAKVRTNTIGLMRLNRWNYITTPDYLNNNVWTELSDDWTKIELDFVFDGTNLDNNNNTMMGMGWIFKDGTIGDDTTPGTTFWLDDFSIRPLTLEESDAYLKKYYQGRYADNLTLSYGFSMLDMSKTPNVIKEGEEADVVAYYNSNADIITTATDLLRNEISDFENLTAVSDNEAVAVYENGKIKANGVGTAKLTFTYNDSGLEYSESLPISVYPADAEVTTLENSPYYAEVMDMDGDASKYTLTKPGVAQNGKGYYTTTTAVASNKPAVISYRQYFGGNLNPAMGTSSVTVGGITMTIGSNGVTANSAAIFFPTSVRTAGNSYPQLGNTQYTQNIGSFLKAGWNNIDIVLKAPSADVAAAYPGEDLANWINMSIYINGKDTIYVDRNFKLSTPASAITYAVQSGIYSFPGLMIDDLYVASMAAAPAIADTNISDNAQISALDSVDFTFTQPVELGEGAIVIKKGDKVVTTSTLLASDGLSVSVQPIGGFDMGSDYTLTLNKAAVTSAGIAMGQDAVTYNFSTDLTDASAVIGEGITLVNSQYDMVANGRYEAINGTVTADGSKLTVVPTTAEDVVKFVTDDTFRVWDSNYAPDAYIIDMDIDKTKVLATDENGDEIPVAVTDNIRINGSTADGTEGQWSVAGHLGRTKELGFVAHGSDRLGIQKYDKDVSLDNLAPVHVRVIAQFNEDKTALNQTLYIKNSEGVSYTYTLNDTYLSIGGNYNIASSVVSGKFINELVMSTSTAIGESLLDGSSIEYSNVNVFAVQMPDETVADFTVNDITVTDVTIDGAEEEITDGAIAEKVIEVSYTLTNNNKADKQSYTVVAAVFDDDNKLMAADIAAPGTVVKGNTTDVITNELDLSELSAEGEYTLKLFVWNGINAATPLMIPVTPFAE